MTFLPTISGPNSAPGKKSTAQPPAHNDRKSAKRIEADLTARRIHAIINFAAFCLRLHESFRKMFKFQIVRNDAFTNPDYFLSEKELAWRERLHHPITRQNWTIGRILVKRLSQLTAPFRWTVISRNAQGEGCSPRLMDAEGNFAPFFFTISHFGEYVAAGICRRHLIGLDLCSCSAVTASVVRNFFTPSEQSFLHETQNRTFAAMIWASKEAAYKASEASEQSHFVPQHWELQIRQPFSAAACELIHSSPTGKRQHFSVEFRQYENHVLVLAEPQESISQLFRG